MPTVNQTQVRFYCNISQIQKKKKSKHMFGCGKRINGPWIITGF